MDELIRITDKIEIPAGEAMTVHRPPGRGRIFVDNIEVSYAEEGDLIVLPLARWVNTLNRAVANEQAAVERVSRQVRRAAARQLRRDAQN